MTVALVKLLGVVHEDLAADARAAALDQRQRDRAVAGRAPIARGDMAERMDRDRLVAVGDDLRALVEKEGRVVGQDADQLLPAGRDQIRPRQRTLADEIRLGLGDHAGKAEIVRRDRAVGFLADDDEAALGAQHMHGLGAIGRQPKRCAARKDRLPDRAGHNRRAH